MAPNPDNEMLPFTELTPGFETLYLGLMDYKDFRKRFRNKRILYIRKDGEGSKKWFWGRSDGFTGFVENARVFDTYHDSEEVRRELMKEKIYVALDPVPEEVIRHLYKR